MAPCLNGSFSFIGGGMTRNARIPTAFRISMDHGRLPDFARRSRGIISVDARISCDELNSRHNSGGGLPFRKGMRTHDVNRTLEKLSLVALLSGVLLAGASCNCFKKNPASLGSPPVLPGQVPRGLDGLGPNAGLPPQMPPGSDSEPERLEDFLRKNGRHDLMPRTGW